MKRLAALLAVAAAASAGLLSAQQPPPMFDLLIQGGRVLDGTGNPWFPANIGIKDGRIAGIGALAGVKAARVIDATGKYVTPGFIDLHSHADDGSRPDGGLRDMDPQIRAAPNLVSQGITTVVVNHDGRSPWLACGRTASHLREAAGRRQRDVAGRSRHSATASAG